MPITHIHTYLVHPAKGTGAALSVGGSPVALSGKIFDLLNSIYERAERECDIAISFNRSAAGAQQNPCRDLILTYVQGPTLLRGRHIAEKLALVTTHRSRMGLLFLIVGTEGLHHKVILSRFPADSGISAEENTGGLNLAFLEKVFMKSAKSYKAVMYKHTSFSTGFWQGHAVDKQMNDGDIDIPSYWIADFLESEFRTTSAAGTHRLAVACRDAARKSDQVAVKSEIAAAVTLVGGLAGERLSIREFALRIGLSAEAKRAIFSELKRNTVDDKFQISADEFAKVIAYRSVELDTGGLLTAEVASFDDVFQKENVRGSADVVKFSTKGKIIGEKIGKLRQ